MSKNIVRVEKPKFLSVGAGRTGEVALVELVKSQLKRPEVLEKLGMESHRDFNTAGLKVFTTIDADMQKSAQLAMSETYLVSKPFCRGLLQNQKTVINLKLA